MKNNFLNYVHYFRGLAIILIVGVHCRTSIPWPENSYVHDILRYGLDSATILFVFISGFLFQYLTESKFNYSSYLWKKIQYVIFPYVIISIPAIVDKLFFETNAYWTPEYYDALTVPGQILYMLVTGKHSGPFYFIPMIGVIFILAPLFHFIQHKKYFTSLTVTVVMLGMFTYSYGYYATFLESLLYFTPVYIFGIWTSKNRNWTVNLNNYILTSLLLIYLTVFSLEMLKIIKVDHLQFFESPHYFTSTFNWGKLKVMCLAVILLNMFYRLKNHDLNIVKTLGDYSFGIYFVHIYIINIISILGKYYHISIEQNALVFTIYLAVVISFSMLIVFTVKKIFRDKSRLVVGS